MPNTIPASAIVNVVPGVISAGGRALDLIGLILTTSLRVPIGTVPSFPSLATVQAYFGAASQEAGAAAVYFAGFDNSNKKPAALLFAQYPTTAVAAYIRGATLGLSLAQLQALPTGTLIVALDGFTRTSGTINLSAASSFSNAASLIQTALNATPPTPGVVTGSITTTVLTVSAVTSGVLAPGQQITGTGVTAGTVILAQLTGATGGIGTYTVSASQTVTSTTITGAALPAIVSYDSTSGAFQINSGLTGALSTVGFVSGTLASSLNMTSVAGAVQSQGAPIGVPAVNMAAIFALTDNWAAFTTLFNPDSAGVITNRLAFAAWVSTLGNQVAYIAWDTDVAPTVGTASASLGAQIALANYSGTCVIWEPSDLNHAAFALGFIASIDFAEQNGRTTFAFRHQSGLAPGVTSQLAGANLIANGYNFYGLYATANQPFNWMQTGSVSGPYLWLDSYVNQIWLNNALQLAMASLLDQAKSIPYNALGYGMIVAACTDPITAAVNFGAIRAGVTLSALQIANVNAAAGLKIDGSLSNFGYYMQVLPATPQVRAQRQTPPCTLWYMDGQSVQQLTLASIEIQ